MRPKDKRIFLDAATHFQSWILVRRTNPDSLAYVGVPGYTPKRLDCKAKTADINIKKWTLAGLVVDPRIHPGAFKDGKTEKALAAFEHTLPLIGTTYSVETSKDHKHYGCLKFNGSFIHGDYDLYDIVDITQPHRNLAAVETMHGTPHRRGPKLLAVQEFVNSRIGSPMVQHGGEAQYTDHSKQAIDAFGPNGEDVTILNEHSVRLWYKDRFGGRQTLS